MEKKEKFDEFLKSNHDGKHLENGSQETSSPSHMSLKNNLCPAKKGKTDELNKFCNDHGPNPPTIQQVHEHHESTYSGRDSTSMQLTFKDSAVVSCSGRITRPEGQHLNSELLNPNQVYLSGQFQYN